MATYNLRKFSHVDGIKGIGEDHLSAVLEPHGEYLAGRGVRLPEKGEDSPLPYQDLVRILMTPDATTPKGLSDAMYIIHEMATPEAMDRLIAGARSRGIELEGAHLTPSDVAAQVFLKDRDLLESAHGQQYMTRLRSFEYFQCGARKVPSFQVPSDDTIASLQSSLASWFESHNRSGEVRVSVFPGDDETSFLVRHGDPLKREGCLGQDERVIYRPEKFDVLVYTPALGEIRMNACSDTEREMYRRTFGFHVFGDEDFFPGMAKYSLEPLKRDRASSCACTDVPGMEWVRLREVHFVLAWREGKVEAWKAYDVFASYADRWKDIDGDARVSKAIFEVKFADSRRPRKVTILPCTLIEEIEYQVEANPALMASIAMGKYGKPKITRKPYFRVELTNGSVLYFRPAGAYGDAFRSLHVDRIWVDEAAWLTEKAWKALRQCLKANGRLRIYSTPNGLRNTTYFRLTTSDQFKVFRWPSWLNPTWTPERESELLEFYGGRDTAGWQHEVAGEHGKPSYGAFNVEHLNLCRQEVIEYLRVLVTGDELKDCETEEDSYDRLEMILNLAPQTGVYWVGGDLGYTNDPTEIVVFREIEVAEKPVLKLVLRVTMEHVSYPHIAQTIALLERYFTPVGIGVDNGGNGLAVVQELLTLDKYRSLDLEGRVKGYDFGGMTTLAVRDGQEVRKRTKEYMTSLINGALQRRQIVFPSDDLDIEDQFTTHTYTLHDGRVVYSKGNDHIVDAVRCAVLVRDSANGGQGAEETVSVAPLVTAPVFV